MSKNRILKKIIAALTVLSFIIIPAQRITAQTLPAGFFQVLVANGIPNPTVMTFAPDGRIFVAEQTGELRVIKNGALLAKPFITLSVNSSGERGLLGIAFDPAFATNNFIYLYHTLASAANNRISRYTASGDTVVPGSEVVVFDLDLLSSATNHNGGTIAFGPDGKLYVGVGENANPPNSQNLNTDLGKILRINSDGSVPAGNPFTTGNAERMRVWEYGMRNPFTLTFQPGTGRLFVDDVGQNTWEEINDCTTGGHDYGWPNAEGMSTDTAYTNPVYTYKHGTGPGLGCAITGGAFFNPSTTNYPASYIGNYFHVDLCGTWIDMLSFNGSSVTNTAFASGIAGSPLSIRTGTDGNLYYLSRDNSAVYKIVYANNSQALTPVADAQVHNKSSVNTNFGSNPALTVRNSSDANGTYQSYLRFDISSLPATNVSVKLRLYGHINNTRTAHITTQIFNVASQTWGESTITFANRPAAQATVLASASIKGTAFSYYEFDLTAFINSLRNSGDTMVSLLVSTPTVTNSSRVVFNSKESASNPPQLVALQSSARTATPHAVENIKNNTASILFSVYPNPAGDHLTIKSLQNITGKKLQLFSMAGTLVYEAMLTNDDEQTISTANLQDGMYILTVGEGESRYVQRVVIQK